MPVISQPSATSSQAGSGKAGGTTQDDDATFANVLATTASSDSSSSSQPKSQKTQMSAADLLAMLVAALQAQSGSSLHAADKSEGAAPADALGENLAGTAGADKTDDKKNSASAGKATLVDLRQLSALLSGSLGTAKNAAGTLQDIGQAGLAADDGLSALKGLSSQAKSLLSKLSASDQDNLVKLLTGQKNVPDAFVQRLQTALAKVDPQLLDHLQGKPTSVTVTSLRQTTGQTETQASTPSTAVMSAAADEQAAATSSTPGAVLHAGENAAQPSHQQAVATASRPAAATPASNDTAGHSGQGGENGQGFLNNKGTGLTDRLAAKTQSSHTDNSASFSLTGLSGHHSPVSHLQHPGEAQLQTPTGTPVSEQHVVDQVVRGVGDTKLKDASSITIKMHPEELGQVKLELTLSKDGLKAHLHTQNQQVQDVLEKHMPKLRHALEQHGLRLDEMRVSVDSGASGGSHAQSQSFFSQHQQSGTPFQSMPRVSSGRMMPAMAPPSVAVTATGSANSGLSVRI